LYIITYILEELAASIQDYVETLRHMKKMAYYEGKSENKVPYFIATK
jgi:hypothetical protein